jgi:acetyl-CoA C-acetyltransferase
MIAGGVESMSRAPFVMPKAESAFSRSNAVYDTTIGWRFVNKLMKAQYGIDSMPETAENVAVDFRIEREAQDRMALASQDKAAAAIAAGHLAQEICAVTIAQKKGDPIVVGTDEHPRKTTLEALAKLKAWCAPTARSPPATPAASTTAPARCCWPTKKRPGSTASPPARVLGMATAGVAPRIMGFGPAGGAQGAAADRPDARADGRDRAQRSLCRPGPGGAARPGCPGRRPARQPLGRRHRPGPPAGRSRRLATTAVSQLHTLGGRYALCTMCIGGQGIAVVLERV